MLETYLTLQPSGGSRYSGGKMKKTIVVFAKERPGLDQVLVHLKSHAADVKLFTGKPPDPLPSAAYELTPDIVISYSSPWILPRELLSRTQAWNINFHPGSPDYPGTGCTNFALYNEEPQHGVTAHLMEPEVDAGTIIGVKCFPVLADDSVKTLTDRCYEHMVDLFIEVMDHIFDKDELPTTSYSWSRKAYNRRALDELCRIDRSMSQAEIDRRVRATYYPDMPGPYLKLGKHTFKYSHGK
ncbi:formyltransferase family protein [Oligoflexia bacterium]|nr:formyltransferase family protein [Oligoflexia bacterium]